MPTQRIAAGRTKSRAAGRRCADCCPDFRDRNATYVANLRDELANSARALEEILDAVNQNDDDHEQRLRKALHKLRNVASSAAAGTAGTVLAGVADSIEQSLRQMRQHHKLATSQFMAEIRVWHKRIDSLESAASLDELKRLASRGEMNEWITSLHPVNIVCCYSAFADC